MPEAKKISLVVPAPITEQISAAQWAVNALTPDLSPDQRHELLQKFRAGRVCVVERRPIGPKEGLPSPKDAELVQEWLYVALHDLDRAWSIFHECVSSGGSARYVAPAEREKIELEVIARAKAQRAPQLDAARDQSAKKRKERAEQLKERIFVIAVDLFVDDITRTVETVSEIIAGYNECKHLSLRAIKNRMKGAQTQARKRLITKAPNRTRG